MSLVFPARCVLCGEDLLSRQAFLCGACDVVVAGDRERPACPRCAANVGPHEARAGRCAQCRQRSSRILGTSRVAPYGPGVARLLRQCKFRGQEQLSTMLGGWLTESLRAAPWFNRVDAVVPVPTLLYRRVRRPFYTADALAREVARRTGLPRHDLLRRVLTRRPFLRRLLRGHLNGWRHQIGLTYTERIANVRGAFALRRGVVLDGARVLLIDDVKTTGATLNECAKVLHRAGAREIYAGVVVVAGWDRATGHAPPAI